MTAPTEPLAAPNARPSSRSCAARSCIRSRRCPGRSSRNAGSATAVLRFMCAVTSSSLNTRAVGGSSSGGSSAGAADSVTPSASNAGRPRLMAQHHDAKPAAREQRARAQPGDLAAADDHVIEVRVHAVRRPPASSRVIRDCAGSRPKGRRRGSGPCDPRSRPAAPRWRGRPPAAAGAPPPGCAPAATPRRRPRARAPRPGR